MKFITTLILAAAFSMQVFAGDIYMTRSGEITFFSAMPLENIEAQNKSVTCILKTATGDMAFTLFMKSFKFDRAAMQEHFNKDYVHSDQFPKATFEGNIDGVEKLDLSKNGKYDVRVNGNLTIHGVTNEVSENGSIEVVDGKVMLNSVFKIVLADYDVKVPSNMIKSINEEIEITVDAVLEKYER